MVVSALGHATFLVAGLLAFASPVPLPDNEEAIAVEVIDASALNQVTRGERKAEKVQEQPLQRAERQGRDRRAQGRGRGQAGRTGPAERARPNSRPPTTTPLRRCRPRAPPICPKPEVKPPEPVKQPQKSGPQRRRDRRAEARGTGQARRGGRARFQGQAGRGGSRQGRRQGEGGSGGQGKGRRSGEGQGRSAGQGRRPRRPRRKRPKPPPRRRPKRRPRPRSPPSREGQAGGRGQGQARDAEIAKNFNASDIAKLLQSKEPAQSTGSAAPQVNRTASLGTERGSSQKLSPSLRGQLVGIIQDQLMKCWNVPIALANARGAVVPQVRDEARHRRFAARASRAW